VGRGISENGLVVKNSETQAADTHDFRALHWIELDHCQSGIKPNARVGAFTDLDDGTGR
jgi:hypothetical protein